MKQKKLTETFVIISNLISMFTLCCLKIYISGSFNDDFRINLSNDAKKCMPGFFIKNRRRQIHMSSDNLTRSLYRFVRTAWNKRQNT